MSLWCIRIIPAHAGFTERGCDRHHECKDHPRTRGVYHTAGLSLPLPSGSSPHTRGLQPTVTSVTVTRRIIPAHAGFTVRGDAGGLRHADHPRTRGVYRPLPLAAAHGAGSSPHTRGLRGTRWGERPAGRIIPAHAGFTLGDPWNPNGPGVYHPPVSFTADLVPARRSCGSAAVEPRWTTTPWAA